MEVEYTLESVDNQVLLAYMSNLEFNDNIHSPESKNSFLYSRLQKSADRPTLVNVLMKKGFAKSESSANFVLLLISIIFLMAAFALIYFNFFYTAPRPVGQESSPGIMIEQATQEYIDQGLTPKEARQRATEDINIAK